MTTLTYEPQHLPDSAPTLAVYLVGAVLALRYIRRYPRPAGLTLASCAMQVASSVAFLFIQGYIISSTEQHVPLPGIMHVTAASIVANGVHVLGVALLLAAVFARRAEPQEQVGPKELVDSAFEPLSQREPHRGVLVLVLGILSLSVCAPLGIAAWVMGKNDLAAMRDGLMDRSGQPETSTGYVLGILGTILFGLGMIGAAFWFAVEFLVRGAS